MRLNAFVKFPCVAALFIIMITVSCSSGERKGNGAKPGPDPFPRAKKENEPPAAKITDRGPVGLYYMQRYWIATRHLEKAVWYFTPDGKVYEGLTTGFSPEDLAAHKGPHGTYKMVGKDLEVTWSDGKSVKSEMERDEGDSGGFAWETGLFAPVKPIADPKLLAGEYEGGTSLSFAGGSSIVSKTLKLNADGTFTNSGIATVKAESDESKVTAAGDSDEKGAWSATDYSMTLKFGDGRTVTGIAFPLFSEDKKQVDTCTFKA
jgi:hypothetical protein